jgi:hypothetical protein
MVNLPNRECCDFRERHQRQRYYGQCGSKYSLKLLELGVRMVLASLLLLPREQTAIVDDD